MKNKNEVLARAYDASDGTRWLIGVDRDRECEISQIEANIAYEYLRKTESREDLLEEAREEGWQM